MRRYFLPFLHFLSKKVIHGTTLHVNAQITHSLYKQIRVSSVDTYSYLHYACLNTSRQLQGPSIARVRLATPIVLIPLYARLFLFW